MLQQPEAKRATRPWRDEARAMLLLAYPLILTNLTEIGLQATDVVLLGWAGPETLAAGALGTNLYNAFLIFSLGLVTASAPMIARELGTRRHSVRDVRRTVRQALWSAVAIGVPILVILWHAEALLLLFGQDPKLAADAGRFLRHLEWGLIPALWYLALRSFVSALERPIWSLLVAAGGIVCNALLNYALIFGKAGLPPLGLVGAGIGSSITNLLMFGAMALVVTRHPHFRRYRLFGRFWRSDWPRFRALWRLGFPIAITLALEVTIFSAAAFLVGLFGTEALAAHAIALQIAALSFMVPLGLGQAATVRVGLGLGRRDSQGIGRSGWTAFALGVGFMSLMALLMIMIPHQLVYLFLDESNPANAPVIALAVSFLAVAAVFQIADGAQVVGAGMLRGLHDTTVPMIYAGVGYWLIGIGVGVGLAFGLGWQGLGIWTGLAAGLGVVAVLMLTRWIRRERLGLIPTV